LESHPDIACFNEVFNFPDKDSEDPSLKYPNFFTFLEGYADGDIRRIFPDRHEKLFLDFLEYLRCFSPTRYLVIDVKYNMTQFFTKPWEPMGSRYLLELISTHGLRVLNITRKNYLRYVLSVLKAFGTGTYTTTSEDSIHDTTKVLSVASMFSEFERCRREDDLIERHFGRYPLFLSYEYARLFPPPAGRIAPDFLALITGWLGVSPSFVRKVPGFRKQSYLTLAETIENYDEVAAALAGTEFEQFLKDEPGYSRRKEVARRGQR